MLELLSAIGVFLLGLSAFLTFIVTLVVKIFQHAKESRMRETILFLALTTTFAALLVCLVWDFLQ